MTFWTFVGLLGVAVFGGLGLVFVSASERVVAWARRWLSGGPVHTEPSYARNFVLGGGFRAYIVFMGILLLLAALLLVAGLIWGDPPARHANVENAGGYSPAVVGC